MAAFFEMEITFYIYIYKRKMPKFILFCLFYCIYLRKYSSTIWFTFLIAAFVFFCTCYIQNISPIGDGDCALSVVVYWMNSYVWLYYFPLFLTISLTTHCFTSASAPPQIIVSLSNSLSPILSILSNWIPISAILGKITKYLSSIHNHNILILSSIECFIL